tara:strand:+ start:306 stop:509 length:204 start_codon:yes stop_codon:yes gene_type:complete
MIPFIFTFQTRNAETKIKLIFLTKQPGDILLQWSLKKMRNLAQSVLFSERFTDKDGYFYKTTFYHSV